jgi:hypothetical protein
MSSPSTNIDSQTSPSETSFISNGTSSTGASTGTSPDVNPDSQGFAHDFPIDPDVVISYLSSPAMLRKNSSSSKLSWVWSHFKRPSNKKDAHVFCLLCEKNVFYTASRTTGMLERHFKRHHSRFFQEALNSGAKKVPKLSKDVPMAQASVKGFMVSCPNFKKCLISWAIDTYQPLLCCEEQSFRSLCLSLNMKSPILSRDKLGTLVQCEYLSVQEKMHKISRQRYYALTADSWTSLANQGYTTCTAHFIDKNTWQLQSLVLGIFEKDGASTAVDTVAYVEHQMELYDLTYSEMVAVATDTEASMISAGRKLVEISTRVAGRTKWHGCVDHLLELVTGIAFKDFPKSNGTMSACRTMIYFFNSSSQAMAKLLAKQSDKR